MEHLVKGHLGGYWIDSRDIEDIEEYCDECGDYDRILLSWQEGHMMEALTNYFSELKSSREIIVRNRDNGITKPEAIQNTLYAYEEDAILIANLLEDNTIAEDEKKLLIKASLQTRKTQIEMICEVYPKAKSLGNTEKNSIDSESNSKVYTKTRTEEKNATKQD